MQSLTIPIKGMHCKSCTTLVADELNKIPGVKHASVSLKSNTATVRYTKEPSEAELEEAVKAAGYTIDTEDKPFFSKDVSVYRQFMMNFAIIIFVLFILSRTGIADISLGGLSNNKGMMALFVGLTAGFSTCMALVGGLVFGLSSRFAEKHPNATPSQKFRPHLFFNIGRILVFFILGGVIGAFGSIFKLNSSTMGILTIIIGFVMIILGLQLTELFPKLSNKGITLPTGIAKFLGINDHGKKEYSHKNALVLGGLTFFLPCGFTQAMQLVAVGSGSFVTGSIVMGLFAIGTAPGLLGVGGLTSLVKGNFGKLFFRFAGALVVLLAIFNISNGLNLTGFKFSLGSTYKSPNYSNQKAEVLHTTFKYNGSAQDISPATFTVKVGQPYILEIDALDDGQGCMSTIMIPGVVDTPTLIRKGKMELPFTVNSAEDYQITCAMGIVRGTIKAI